MQEQMLEQCGALQSFRRDFVKLILGSEEAPRGLDKAAASYERKFDRFHEQFSNSYHDGSVNDAVAGMGVNEWLFGSTFIETFNARFKTHQMHYSELQTLVKDTIMSIGESDPTKHADPKPKNSIQETPAPKLEPRSKKSNLDQTGVNLQENLFKLLKKLQDAKEKVIMNIQTHKSRQGSKLEAEVLEYLEVFADLQGHGDRLQTDES
jgi:hypothetical protein